MARAIQRSAWPRRWPWWVARLEAKPRRFFSAALALKTLALELEDCCLEDDVFPVFWGMEIENGLQVTCFMIDLDEVLYKLPLYSLFIRMNLAILVWFSMVLEQNIQQIAAVTWSCFGIGLCWSMTTVAMPRGVFIEYVDTVSKMKPSNIHTHEGCWCQFTKYPGCIVMHITIYQPQIWSWDDSVINHHISTENMMSSL